MAKRIYRSGCCRNGCLGIIGENHATKLLIGCMEEMSGLSRDQKHEAIFQKILHSTKGVSQGGYLDCAYNLGVGIQSKGYGVCHTCFERAYDIGHTQLYKIRNEIKRGWMTSNLNNGVSHCSSVGVEMKNNPLFTKRLLEMAAARGYSLDKYEVAALTM